MSGETGECAWTDYLASGKSVAVGRAAVSAQKRASNAWKQCSGVQTSSAALAVSCPDDMAKEEDKARDL